jgi:hypothetical protein
VNVNGQRDLLALNPETSFIRQFTDRSIPEYAMSAVRNLMLILFIAIVTRPAMAAGGDVINGYAKYTGGEHIGYRSFHPYAKSSLLTRCLDGKSTITWETDAVPQTATGESVTFVWVAAHSSGTSTALY